MTINGECKVVRGIERGFWAEYDHFCFIAVEFEEIVAHPGFYVCDAVGEGRKDFRSDRFGVYVKLGIVGIAVEVESMAADDVSKWKYIEDEKYGAKN